MKFYSGENALPFESEMQSLRRCSKICEAWTRFFSPERIAKLLELGAERTVAFSDYDRFSGAVIGLSVDEGTALRGIRALMDRDPQAELEFRRPYLSTRFHEAKVALDRFVQAPSGLTLAFTVAKHIVVAPSSFRLQHQLRRGMRWARMYCTDYRITNKDGLVAQLEFTTNATREEMFTALLEVVESKGDEFLYSITTEGLTSALIKANERKPYDSFLWDI